MNSTREHLEHLSEIRDLMERSSKFLSLSGLSGIVAGIAALLGAGVAHLYLGYETGNPHDAAGISGHPARILLLADALVDDVLGLRLAIVEDGVL